MNNGSVSRYDNHMSNFAFRIISLMQQTLGKFDQKASQTILFSRFFVCKEIVNMLNWNKVLVEGGNHNLKCTPVEKGESEYVKKKQLQKYASNLSTSIYLKVGRGKMREQVQRKGKKMRNTFRYTGVLQNFTQDLIDRRT